MRSLETTLRDYDLDLLRIIAGRWDIDLPSGDARAAAGALVDAMRDTDRAEATWAHLNEAERGALQTLHGAGGRMTTAQFTAIFGKIREMGRDRRKKETPYLNPTSIAERLFYRGLISAAFDENDAGAIQAYTYIPDDLRDALPFANTTTPDTGALLTPADAPDAPMPIDESAVEDMTTLLAYLRMNTIGDALRDTDQAALRPHLQGTADTPRLTFLLRLLTGMELIAPDDTGILRLSRTARAWLEAARTVQAQRITLAWIEGAYYNDLRNVPGLVYEDGGGQNDPIMARQAVFHFLAMLTTGAWWSLDALIAVIKEEAPDFQRPTGEWDSWYIRDAESGDYLRGFESWDRVDGALIRHLITGPMRWLGLVQLDAHDALFCLTAQGMAALGLSAWPDAPDAPSLIEIAPDGSLTAPYGLSRYDRFQLARIAAWETRSDTGYTYRFTPASLRQAGTQGIKTKHILTFLHRATGDQVPTSLAEMLEGWAEGRAPVTLRSAVLMHAGTPEALERLQNKPNINRYLGRPLGPAVVEVRPGMWPELCQALRAIGVLPEIDGLEEDEV